MADTPPASGHSTETKRGRRPDGYWSDDPSINSLYNCVESMQRDISAIGSIAVMAFLLALLAFVVAVTR